MERMPLVWRMAFSRTASASATAAGLLFLLLLDDAAAAAKSMPASVSAITDRAGSPIWSKAAAARACAVAASFQFPSCCEEPQGVAPLPRRVGIARGAVLQALRIGVPVFARTENERGAVVGGGLLGGGL